MPSHVRRAAEGASEGRSRQRPKAGPWALVIETWLALSHFVSLVRFLNALEPRRPSARLAGEHGVDRLGHADRGAYTLRKNVATWDPEALWKTFI